MCTVSYIGDQWAKTVPYQYPNVFPAPGVVITNPAEISREEFDALKNELTELKELLKAAKRFDANTGQPDCETDDKVALLRRIAELVGVDLEDVLSPAQPVGLQQEEK